MASFRGALVTTTPATLALPTSARPNLFVRLVGSPWFWLAFILVSMTVHITRAVLTNLPAPLPVLGVVPDFEFTNQHGERYGSEQLRGKVWVANFIFTRCPTICPMSTTKMAGVQHRSRNLGEGFHLVSFSVDPEHDQPHVLQSFAQKYRASPRMWTFLTGDREKLRQTLVDGLKVHMTQGETPDDLMSIGHSAHFVLIDSQMRIRGYYDTNEAGMLDKIVRDAGLVANRGG
jgi:protein SCO1